MTNRELYERFKEDLSGYVMRVLLIVTIILIAGQYTLFDYRTQTEDKENEQEDK
jgi:hypothetical protein